MAYFITGNIVSPGMEDFHKIPELFAPGTVIISSEMHLSFLFFFIPLELQLSED